MTYNKPHLDADKGGYIKYFNYVLDNKMLTKNGLIVADNGKAYPFSQYHAFAVSS